MLGKRYPLGTMVPATDPDGKPFKLQTEGTVEQLTAPDADLLEWAKEHGPPYLSGPAGRGVSVKAGVLNFVAHRLAARLEGLTVVIVEGGTTDAALVHAKERQSPSEEATRLRSKVEETVAHARSWLALPPGLTSYMSPVVRVERQQDCEDRKAVQKFTAVIVTLRHPSMSDRYLVVNIEAKE